MRKLKINRTDFELAFELGSYETTAYLDTETGASEFLLLLCPISVPWVELHLRKRIPVNESRAASFEEAYPESQPDDFIVQRQKAGGRFHGLEFSVTLCQLFCALAFNF